MHRYWGRLALNPEPAPSADLTPYAGLTPNVALDALESLGLPCTGTEYIRNPNPDPDNAGEIVAPSLDFGGGGEHRDAARGACRLVPRRRESVEYGIGHAEKSAEQTLLREQFRRAVSRFHLLAVGQGRKRLHLLQLAAHRIHVESRDRADDFVDHVGEASARMHREMPWP